MGVVFDEVVAQVEAAPKVSQVAQSGEAATKSEKQQPLSWQQQQVIYQRHRQRLEAD